MITSWVFWLVVAVGVAVYWQLPRYRDLFVFLLSAGYIASLDWVAVAWLLGFSTLAFASAQKLSERHRWLSVVAAAGVGAFLAYYKYAPPLLQLATRHASVTGPVAAGEAAEGVSGATAILVPLGSSYFTFKLIHYVIECRRKHIGAHTLWSFFAYMFFLPTFTAGPIERFDDFLKNREQKFRIEMLYGGGTRIAYGLIKKFVLVNLLFQRTVELDPHDLRMAVPLWYPALPVEDLMTDLGSIHPLYAWQFVINHYVTWYVDFSAYCDIAVGLGLLFGVRGCENFDWPFLVTNIGDFWKRYHMSLSNWAQRYVYFPMLGWTRNAQLALFTTMIAIGLWHAGNMNYLAWGTYQAVFLSLHLVWTRYKRRRLADDEEGTSGFARFAAHPALGVAGGVITFLGVCASSSFPSTQGYGLWSAARLFAVLFGVRLHD